jgi:hypothetical protein
MHSSLNENKGLPRTEAVQNELAAILASRTFARSERHRRFLSYIVEKALNSQATDVKEYSIAIEVFDRPSSYDPQVDSLVRVEASKLRSRLQRYYETEGAGHAVRIDIPKGTYLPAFSRPVDDQTATPSTRRWLPFAIAGIAAIGVLGGFGVYTYRMLRYVPIPFQNPQIMRLTELTDVRYAVISPNGQYVAYVRGGDGEHSLWIKHIESKKEMQLVSKGEPFFMGSTFAPDSRHLYYVVQSKQTRLTSLYRIPIAGGTPVRLKDNLDSPISFSPDGNYIAFIREKRRADKVF